MILVATDKYRGTLTAGEASEIIASCLKDPCMTLPMADGGEGTAEALAAGPDWLTLRPGVKVNRLLRQAVVDSSAVIGYSNFPPDMAPMDRTSAPLGQLLNDLYREYHPRTIYIGVGGTAICDGGRGLLESLNPNVPWSAILHGLVDVEVPLLPSVEGGDSALMFCRQKGFSEADMPRVVKNLQEVIRLYGPAVSRFDGAGGGLGYALASALSAPCELGAEFILRNARIPWEDITDIITGEGRYDRQTRHGKVVATLAAEGVRRGIPVVCLAGCVESGATPVNGLRLIDTSAYLPDHPLTPTLAAQRLSLATISHFPSS